MVTDLRRKVPVYNDVVIKGEIEKVERYVSRIINCHGNKIQAHHQEGSQPFILLKKTKIF